MSYVMVPCPEEFADEVRLGLLRLTLGISEDQMVGFTDHVASLEGPELDLLVAVATTSVEDQRVPFRDVAQQLEIEVGDVLELATEVNAACLRADLPGPLITETQTRTDADGEETARPVLVMLPFLARAVLDADRRSRRR
jgi:hypothetical protein